MLGLISFILLLSSTALTYFWNTPSYIVDPDDERQVARRERILGNFQRASIFSIIVSYIFSLIIWTSGWHSIWGILAGIAGIWGIVYFYLCHKKGISPLEGRIVSDSVKNYFLVDAIFTYVYFFTWAQLVIICIPYYYQLME